MRRGVFSISEGSQGVGFGGINMCIVERARASPSQPSHQSRHRGNGGKNQMVVSSTAALNYGLESLEHWCSSFVAWSALHTFWRKPWRRTREDTGFCQWEHSAEDTSGYTDLKGVLLLQQATHHGRHTQGTATVADSVGLTWSLPCHRLSRLPSDSALL
jgi:hypothetical protein